MVSLLYVNYIKSNLMFEFQDFKYTEGQRSSSTPAHTKKTLIICQSKLLNKKKSLKRLKVETLRAKIDKLDKSIFNGLHFLFNLRYLFKSPTPHPCNIKTGSIFIRILIIDKCLFQFSTKRKICRIDYFIMIESLDQSQ